MTKVQLTPAKSEFRWISNRSYDEPYVTIDNQKRLYISKPARELLGLPDRTKFKLIAGYDFANHRIVLAKPEVVRVPDVQAFPFDKRAYSKVSRFVEKARIGGNLPVRFLYVGRDYSEYPSGAYAFTMEGYEAEDV